MASQVCFVRFTLPQPIQQHARYGTGESCAQSGLERPVHRQVERLQFAGEASWDVHHVDVGILQLRRGAELGARVDGRTIEQLKDGPRDERLRQLIHELQHSRDIAPGVCAVAHEHIGTGQDNVGQRFGCCALENDLRPTSRSMRLACQQTRQLSPRVSDTYGAFSSSAPAIIGGGTQANCSLVCVHPTSPKG